MQVAFERPLCGKHKLPLIFLCSNEQCTCGVRLCQKCAQDHAKKKDDVQEEFIKDKVYQKKIEIETELAIKQYYSFEKYQKSLKEGLTSSQHEVSIRYAEAILKAINEEKKNIFVALQQFNFNHFEVKKKLLKVKNMKLSEYLTSLKNRQIIPMAVRMFSDAGLEQCKKKLMLAHTSIQKYQEFMNAVKKYGSSQQEFIQSLGFKENSLIKNQLKVMLNTCKVDKANNRKVSHNFDRARFDQNSGKQRINTRSREKIGESPRRRINVFTGQVRNIA